MRKITLIATSFITALTVAGCANVNVSVNTDTKVSVADEQGKNALSESGSHAGHEPEAGPPEGHEPLAESRQSVAGPYGQLSIAVPDDFECKVCPLDNDEMSYGYYGFTVHPRNKKDGIIAIFVANNFGVCGTDLKQEETRIAGKPARIGTYDDHERWDFIVMGEDDPQIAATGGACDSWTDDQWDTVQKIIDTIEFDPSVIAGAVWQYTPESEDSDIGVSMDLSNITPSGATVHFYRFSTENAGELSYGEPFVLEKENAGKWEAVPRIIEEAAYTDIAHIIPENDSSEIETDWEWLYGPLSPGTYRIRKLVYNYKDNDRSEHVLVAQFLLAGPAIKNVMESDFGTYYEMSDGTWMHDGHYYKYRLEISGRMNNAAKDSTCIYLSNIEDIPFDRAVMASGLSSNMADYFSPEEAVFVGWKE